MFAALARDLLANGRPLYCRIGTERFYPGLRVVWGGGERLYGHAVMDSIQRSNLWRTFPFDAAVFAPIPFTAGEIPSRPPLLLAPPGAVNPHLGAGRVFRHWLGTDTTGYDVAAGVVYGARIALLTGTLAMLIALLIGLFLGAIAGFWGDRRLTVRRGVLWGILFALLPGWFYGFVARAHLPAAEMPLGYAGGGALIFAGFLAAFYLLGLWLSRYSFFSKKTALPADMLIMRAAEVLNSIPRLVFVIAIAVLLPQNQSIWLMIALIGALSWTTFARFTRAELLRIRELDYIAAAEGMAFPRSRILLRHALPNALRAVVIAFALGMSQAILLESSLSFLGFGSDAFANKSWGSLLQNAQQNRAAWWIAIPPGLLICLTVWALHVIGERISARK